nr:MAG TPA: hypothetical protein [Caudoviricetes sp.]
MPPLFYYVFILIHKIANKTFILLANKNSS